MSIPLLAPAGENELYAAGRDEAGTTFHYIAKYNTSGNQVWKLPLANDILFLTSMTVDNGFNVILAGYSSSSGVRIKKLNASGAEIWTLHLPGFVLQGTGISVDEQDRIYLPVRKIFSNGPDTTFIKMIEPSGSVSKTSAPFLYCRNLDIAAGENGEVFVTGQAILDNNLNFYGRIGTTSLGTATAGWTDGNFLVKLDDNLQPQWVVSSYCQSSSYTNSVVLDQSGTVYTCWKQRPGSEPFVRPTLNKYNGGGQKIDSIIFEDKGKTVASFLQTSPTDVFVAFNVLKEGSNDDTAFLYKVNNSLSNTSIARAYCDNIKIQSLTTVAGDAFIGGKLNDVNGMANFQGLNMEVYTNVPFAYDIFIARSAMGSTVPLKLLSFNAARSGNNAMLTWRTAAEENGTSFIVQRSIDGMEYKDIAKLISTNPPEHFYSHSDDNPVQGKNYYRLKIVEPNGSLSYSKVEMLTFGRQENISVFPNPAKAYAPVQVAVDHPNISTLLISTANGQLVRQFRLNGPTTVVINNLASATYLLTLVTSSDRIESRLVVQ